MEGINLITDSDVTTYFLVKILGPRFNIKMTSYQYRKSHCGDKTIWRPFYLHNGISYTGKMTSLYWIGALITTTVYPKKYAHGFCFAVLCCGYTLTDFPISIRLTSLALWQSNDCPSASKATLMNMDKYFMWIHYERLHNHNKAKHNKTVCIFLGIYGTSCTEIVTWISNYITKFSAGCNYSAMP